MTGDDTQPFAPALRCDRCGAALPAEACSRSASVPCTGCGAAVQALVFPAFALPPHAAESAAPVLVDGHAGCFYHADKQAVVACERCGRFLCALCDLDLGDCHVCPRCLDAGTAGTSAAEQPNEVLLGDTIALSIAVYPALFIWPTLITAPLALFLALRYWRRPRGPLPRSRIRLIAAGGLALVQMAGWALLATLIILD